MRNPNQPALATAGKATKVAAAAPCCSKDGLKRGPWTPEEDEILSSYVKREGEGRWRTLPKRAGLLRCGKSCRLRWMNYLRPSVKHGHIEPDEEDLILRLHRLLGNRKPEHMKMNCSKLTEEKNEKSSSDEDETICYHCRKRGHIRPNCPLLKKGKAKDRSLVHTWDDDSEDEQDHSAGCLALMAHSDQSSKGYSDDEEVPPTI